MARGWRRRRTLVAITVTGVVVTLAMVAWLTGAVRVGDGGGGRAIVEGAPSAERDAALKQAEEGTRERRDAARQELERLPTPR